MKRKQHNKVKQHQAISSQHFRPMKNFKNDALLTSNIFFRAKHVNIVNLKQQTLKYIFFWIVCQHANEDAVAEKFIETLMHQTKIMSENLINGCKHLINEYINKENKHVEFLTKLNMNKI